MITRAQIAAITAHGIAPDEIPVVPRLCSRILKQIESGTGELCMSRWHGDPLSSEHEDSDVDYCSTTHCVAGWTTNLAGKKGRALELEYGTFLAARLIWQKTLGYCPEFYCNEELALSYLVAGTSDEVAL